MPTRIILATNSVAVAALAAGLASVASDACGEDTIDYGEIESVERSAPLERDARVSGLDVVGDYFEAKQRFVERTGLNYLVEYGLISQWGSYGDDRFHADHELNVIGMWDLVESESAGRGKLMWWYQNSVTLGSNTTSDLQQSLGVLSPVNGGDTAPDRNANRLQLLAWEQRFSDDRTRLVAGKLTTRTLMNLNRYAVSDREDFFSPMVVNNPVVPFTARLGLGVFGEFRSDSWYVSGMFRDADATDDFVDFDSVGNGNWEYAAEFGLTPNIEGLGEGNYRFTGHYSDAIGEGMALQASGWSLALSFDQDFGESVGGFFRYAYADEPLRAFRQRIALGAQIKSPFQHPEDVVGIGGWWGEPTDEALRDEYGLELFYKIQLTRNLALSPEIMVVFDPSLAPERDLAFVGGLRMRLEF